MEFRCAECGCVIDTGVRLAVCDRDDCCCRDLPIRGPGEQGNRS